MNVFRCTAKMQTKLKGLASLTDEVPDSPTPFRDWFCTPFTVDRRVCVLFTDSSTLYAVLVFGVRKTDLAQLGEMFRTALQASLSAEAFSPAEIDLLLPRGPDRFARTNNRSVLGSMNDYIFHVRHHIEWEGRGLVFTDPRDIEHRLNDMPMSAIKSDALRKTRELLVKLGAA